MTQRQLICARNGIVRALGFRSYDALRGAVIGQGFHVYSAAHPCTLARWRWIESGFHAAQMFHWAAESRGDARARWVDAAGRQLRTVASFAREIAPDGFHVVTVEPVRLACSNRLA